MSARVYQPLHWREKCWATLERGAERPPRLERSSGHRRCSPPSWGTPGGCSRYRRPGYLTCREHNDRELEARALYLSTSAPEREGIDREELALEVQRFAAERPR